MVDGAALEVVDKSCYLGNMINAGGGAEVSMIVRTRSGDLLPVLTCRGFFLCLKGRVYQARDPQTSALVSLSIFWNTQTARLFITSLEQGIKIKPFLI